MIKTKYIPLALFVAFFIKVLILKDVSLVDSSVLLILAGASAFYEYKSNDKKLRELEIKVNSIKKELQDNIDLNTKELKEFNSYISSLKIQQQMRQGR